MKRAYRFLGRMDVAAVLILVVLLLVVLGSCFPQLSPPVAADAGRLAQWEVAVRARYGGLADVLTAIGAFRCFRSPVFLVPLALLAVATLVCTFDRWRGLWRRAFRQPVRCSQAALDGAPYTARLSVPIELPAPHRRGAGGEVPPSPHRRGAGGEVPPSPRRGGAGGEVPPSPRRGGAGGEVDLPNVVCECLEERGFRVRATEVATTDRSFVYLRGDRNRLTSLATLVTHLAVLLLLVGAALSGGYGWREEVTLGPGEAVEIGHTSGLTLRNTGFTVERYPDGSAAGYEAQVAFIVEGQGATSGHIRVNEPLNYGPVRLYLRGYDGTAGQYSITLLAVHDPGYGPVIAAGFLLLLGMTASFNFPHCCIRARIEPEGTLCLAGRADRRAYDFEREFAALVEEIRHAVDSARESAG